MFFNQMKQTKKNLLSIIYVFIYLRKFFPFNVIIIRIMHIEIDKKHFANDFSKANKKI